MGVEEVKEYLGHLLESGASPEKFKMHIAGLKFLYGVTLDRKDVAEKIPWPKVPHKKPDILSLSEVERLLAASTSSLVPTMVSMAAYAGGLRISEACRLRPEDIDSERMLIHVRLGKGNKDRFVMLSEHLLMVLRAYWKKVRPQGGWMFPGRKRGEPISRTAVGKALNLHLVGSLPRERELRVLPRLDRVRCPSVLECHAKSSSSRVHVPPPSARRGGRALHANRPEPGPVSCRLAWGQPVPAR